MTLTMTGRHRDLLCLSVASLLLYVVASPYLVDRFGVNGAAAAFTLQTIVLNVAVTLRAKQTVGIWTIPLTSWSAAREEASFLLRRFKR
jgi:O-antigen/teichoic acid export membrane protein